MEKYIQLVLAVTAGFIITGVSLFLARKLSAMIDAKRKQKDPKCQNTNDEPCNGINKKDSDNPYN
jgi:hypothetical protein